MKTLQQIPRQARRFDDGSPVRQSPYDGPIRRAKLAQRRLARLNSNRRLVRP